MTNYWVQGLIYASDPAQRAFGRMMQGACEDASRHQPAALLRVHPACSARSGRRAVWNDSVRSLGPQIERPLPRRFGHCRLRHAQF